jgi:hypothetical protein
VVSALSGGLLTVFGVLAIGAAMPSFRRYQSPTPAPEPSAVTATHEWQLVEGPRTPTPEDENRSAHEPARRA